MTMRTICPYVLKISGIDGRRSDNGVGGGKKRGRERESNILMKMREESNIFVMKLFGKQHVLLRVIVFLSTLKKKNSKKTRVHNIKREKTIQIKSYKGKNCTINNKNE